MQNIKHEFIQANGINIHYVTAGQGPLLILLHGFPQFWYAWRHQIPALAEYFKVVVPDLRGYGDTDKPKEISQYRPEILAADIVGLIHALGYEKANIIGHDWGGGVAWKVALDHPEAVGRLAVLNCPHPYVFARALKSNLKQLLRSWYIFFFQIPYIPEFILKRGSKSLLTRIFRGTAIHKGTFTDDDIQQYHQALMKPGAIEGALNYYRAAFRKGANKKRRGEVKKIAVPTLVMWGENDSALGKELTYGMESLFSGPFHLEYIPNCSHWVNEEQPDLVNKRLLQFFCDKKGK